MTRLRNRRKIKNRVKKKKHHSALDVAIKNSNQRTTFSFGKETIYLVEYSLRHVRQGIETCGKHPFATGLFALIGLAGLIFSIISFDFDRKEAKETTEQIQDVKINLKESINQIVIILTNKYQIDSRAKDEHIKALTQAISELSKGQDILGSKKQIEAAMTALAQGNTEKAKQLFSKAAKKGEQYAQQTAKAYRNLGAIAFLDDTQEATQAYQRATKLDPNDLISWNQLGHLLKRTGKLNQAISAYNKILTLGGNNQDKKAIAIAYGNLGVVYQAQGELDKAIEFYQKALTIDEALGRKKGIAIAYSNLGYVYQTQGNPAKAKHYWKMSIIIFKELDSPTAQKIESLLNKL
jgi:tetratricopeptide (TPR) repeat protein